jgi:CRP-like cAMP-binding protein
MFHTTEHAAKSGATPARTVRNGLLRALSPDEFDFLKPHLKQVAFRKGTVIYAQGSRPVGLYFIESGLVSRSVFTREHAPFEIALEGKDGVLGLGVVFGLDSVIHQTTALTPVVALMLDVQAALPLLAERAFFRGVLLRHAHKLTAHMSHLTVCNTKHALQERVPRWLLAASERTGNDVIPITHDLIAALLGVRRPGVTEVLTKLEEDQIISKARGAVRILDAKRLALQSCGCERLIEESEARLATPAYSHLLTY